MTDEESGYRRRPDGIRARTAPVEHRGDEYDEAHLNVLARMQARHFWYRGRHRFLFAVLTRLLRRPEFAGRPLAALDLGGGCGGWIGYLRRRGPALFAELALADSSLKALEMAAPVVGAETSRYHTDLLHPGWRARWDVVFLLDVLEHIPEDERALEQIGRMLRPGGALVVTTPALGCFWSMNDVLAGHQRRYKRHGFRRLASAAGLTLETARYFNFFLSPLLLLSRLAERPIDRTQPDEVRAYFERTHRVPGTFANGALAAVFELEAHIGVRCPLPWGTSVLGVFRKPGEREARSEAA